MIDYKVKNYGLFRDEGREFSFTNTSYSSAADGSFHCFINGKFVKSDEEYKGERH
ncbi:hypothetical protein [Campylobacter sp. US33a]|uniref:hypothetical protein n=1 Tax=Campylobacter sp. US33a TaxID=2498120 RepID=UPI001FB8FED8|nr:hypothetical protein [Campylobacter sp. US33a]